MAPDTPDARTRTWRRITLVTLFVGYAGYYICRQNLSVASNLLIDGGLLTEIQYGLIGSVGVILYAVGKISNGVLSDFLGGRTMFLTGIVVSIACTVVFGLSGGVAAFLIVWAFNRYFQSMGWGALVKVSSHWFPTGSRATMLGILSASYLVGGALTALYLGSFIAAGFGWRGIFFIAAGSLAVVGVFCAFFLKSSPRDVGAEEPAADPDCVYGEAGNHATQQGIRQLLRPLFTSRAFYFVCIMNIGLTVLRETFNHWTPRLFKEVVGLDDGPAAIYSMVFPGVGILSVLLSGWLSDRLGRQRGRIIVPCLAMALLSLAGLCTLPIEGNAPLALGLIGSTSFFLLAPYSFLSGVMAIDLGGKRGSSSAAGFIDSAGYFGGALSGVGIGWIATQYNWHAVLITLAGVGALSLAVAAVHWVFEEVHYFNVKKRAGKATVEPPHLPAIVPEAAVQEGV